jgi:hypothetical protein
MAKKRVPRKAGGPKTLAEVLMPPCVSWRDDDHARRAAAPKRIQRRIERIARDVWRMIPDPARHVIGLVPHDIQLMTGPVGKGPPDRKVGDISRSASWHEMLGIFLDTEGESSGPRWDARFSYAIAHELAHAYLNAASMLIHTGANLLAARDGIPAAELPRLRAIADFHNPEGERDRDSAELMMTALAISWGFGPEYLVVWQMDREARGVPADAPDDEMSALLRRRGR